MAGPPGRGCSLRLLLVVLARSPPGSAAGAARWRPADHAAACSGDRRSPPAPSSRSVYFAGFTSVFFTLSILWQMGLGHSALSAGLVTRRSRRGRWSRRRCRDRLSARLGRKVLVLGCAMVRSGWPGRRGDPRTAPAPAAGSWPARCCWPDSATACSSRRTSTSCCPRCRRRRPARPAACWTPDSGSAPRSASR